MKAKISRLQYFLIIPNLFFGKAIGITAGITARKVGWDTWTSMLIGFIGSFVIIGLITYLSSNFPKKSIIAYSEELLGKWVAKGIGIVLILFFILAYGVSANTMTLHFKEYFLMETPTFVICLLFTLLCMYGVFLGIEVIVRFSLAGFIMAFLTNITVFLGTYKDINLINLLPIMDTGVFSNLAGSIYTYGDTAMLILTIGFLYPMLNSKEKVFSLTFWSVLLGTLLVLIWPVLETAVMGQEMMKQYVLVNMQQTRCAALTKYYPRAEFIMVSFFTFTMFVQSATLFYCAKYAIKQISGLKKDWIIILPLTLLLVFITYYMAIDPNNFLSFLTFPYSQICATISIGLPVLLLLAALFRGKLKKKKTTLIRSIE